MDRVKNRQLGESTDLDVHGNKRKEFVEEQVIVILIFIVSF